MQPAPLCGMPKSAWDKNLIATRRLKELKNEHYKSNPVCLVLPSLYNIAMKKPDRNTNGLDEVRKEIDQLDEQIQSLISERAQPGGRRALRGPRL